MNLSILVSLGSAARRPAGPDCGSYASLASQHSSGCGALSRFTPPTSEPFPSLWAIRVVYRHFWPTITLELYCRGRFAIFCGGGMGVAAVFSPLWPTITLGVRTGRCFAGQLTQFADGGQRHEPDLGSYRQVALVPGAWHTTEFRGDGRAHGDKPCLEQHMPGRDIRIAVTGIERLGSGSYGGWDSSVSPVWRRNPAMRAGWRWMRPRDLRMAADSWSKVAADRLPRAAFMLDQTPSTGLRSGA